MIKVLEPTDSTKLDEFQKFVRTNPAGVATQDTSWATVKNNWGHLFLYHENLGGDIDAIMSIFTVEAIPGKVLAYVPKGPIIGDQKDVQLVNDFIDAAIENLPENTFLIRMDPEWQYSDELNNLYQQAGFKLRNKQGAPMHYNIQPRNNMIYDLTKAPDDQEGIVSLFSKNGRRDVRYAFKEDLRVDISNSPESFEVIYQLYEKMAKFHGISYRPKEYFDRIRESMAPDNLVMNFIVYDADDNPIEGMLTMNFGKKSWFVYAGLDRDFRNSTAPYFNRFKWLQWAKRNGFELGDLGGFDHVGNDDGLYTNKKKYLGNQEPTVYIGEIDKVLDQDGYDEYLKQFS